MNETLSFWIDVFLAIYSTAAVFVSLIALYLRDTDTYIVPGWFKGFFPWLGRKLRLRKR